MAAGDADDPETILETLPQAGEHIAEVASATNNEEVGKRVEAEGPREAVTDKGYHSNDTLQALAKRKCEPMSQNRIVDGVVWRDRLKARQAVWQPAADLRERGKELLRRRGKLPERSFAHAYETGGMRVFLRGRKNVLKRVLIHVGALNLSLVMRQFLGKGTPRSWQGDSANELLILLQLGIVLLVRTEHECASMPS